MIVPQMWAIVYFRGFLCTSVDNHTAIGHETCFASECPGVSRLYVAERCSFLMVYSLVVDVFLSQKARKGASKSRAVRGVFYVAMIQQIISELARLFDAERRNFLMVYPLVVDVFLSQKARKGASKSFKKPASQEIYLSGWVDEKNLSKSACTGGRASKDKG